jgi:hypothetical protein
MAIFAGVVGPAAFHFDGDDVERGVVVEAAGLGIEVEAVDFGGECRHWMGGSEEENSKERVRTKEGGHDVSCPYG